MFVSLKGSFFGTTLKDTSRHTLNLSNSDLSDAESFRCHMISTLICRQVIYAIKKLSVNLSSPIEFCDFPIHKRPRYHSKIIMSLPYIIKLNFYNFIYMKIPVNRIALTLTYVCLDI